jgi:hypothetical protein
MNRYLITLLGSLTVFCACSPRGDLQTAEKAVDAFRTQYNASQFRLIYQATDRDFQSTAQLPEFVAYEQTVQSKLGAFQSAEVTNYNVVYVFGGSEVRLDYDSKYAKARAPETFTVKVKSGKATISGYRIDSPLLPQYKN